MAISWRCMVITCLGTFSEGLLYLWVPVSCVSMLPSEPQKMLNFPDTVSSTSASSKVLGSTALIGAGVGSFLQASFSVTQALVSPARVTDAVGFICLGTWRPILPLRRTVA